MVLSNVTTIFPLILQLNVQTWHTVGVGKMHENYILSEIISTSLTKLYERFAGVKVHLLILLF